MKKRIRKKLHLGEFRELGFQLRFRVRDTVSDAELDSWWDDFITEAIEGNKLLCGGASGREWNVFVTLDGRGSATDEHRATLERWLRARGDVDAIDIGPLVDMWHGA